MLLLLFVAVFSMTLTACSDDDNQGGQPEITGVKVLSDTINHSYDATYDNAGAGTMIAIMGNNLGGALKVYINDQSVYFNSTMNTDHSIIVTIPSEKDGFKLSAFDSTIPDEIRVETTHGSAVYAFKVTAPGPQVQRLEGAYPRESGDTVRLYGLNLVDVKKVYITDAQSAALDTTTWTDVPGNHYDVASYFDVKQDHHLNTETKAYETTSVLGVKLSSEVPDSGSIVVECAAGTSYVGFYKRPGKPVILSVSNDMPMIGETLVLTGREFVQVESVTYGDVTLDASQFSVSETQDSIFIPFAQKPSENSATEIIVTTPGGSATASRFYDYTTLLATFDNDDATDNGWSPKATLVDGGTADGNYEYINVASEGTQWWGTMIFFRKDWNGNTFSFSNNIPATATADELYFTMDVYDAGDFNNGVYWGYLRYTIFPIGDAENQYDNFEWADYASGLGSFPDGPVLQDITGLSPKNQWHRAVVPLSKFACYQGKTLADIRTIGLNQFRIQSINQGTVKGKVDVKVDNVRVIYIPSK